MSGALKTSPIKRPLDANHRPDGSFAPGNCANPTGRPKTRTITEAYRAILADRGAEELARIVYTDGLTAKKPSDRLAAVQEITDRVEGKAVQAHTVQTGIDAGAARVLADLAGRILSQVVLDGDTNRPLLLSDDPSESDEQNQ